MNSEAILQYLDNKEKVLKAYSSFHEFIKQSWHIIEGNIPFVDSWHIKALSEHLEACYKGDIRKLLINIPPRTSKSSIISVMFPVWVWLQDPEEKFLYASFARGLATGHALKCRRLIESDWFCKRYNHIYKINKDKNAVLFFENNKGGYRKITSVGGSATGEGGSIIIADDPNSTGEYTSKVKMQSAIDWWNSVWLTKLNNPKNDIMVLVQQRLHENDISGHIMNNDLDDEWTKLILPMEYEESRKAKTIILPSTNGEVWQDPRKEEGELLCDTNCNN